MREGQREQRFVADFPFNLYYRSELIIYIFQPGVVAHRENENAGDGVDLLGRRPHYLRETPPSMCLSTSVMYPRSPFTAPPVH